MYHIILLTFQHPWATNIPLVLLVERPPMYYGFTTPEMTDQTSKGLPPKGRRDRVPSNPPACNQPIHPGLLVGFTMFTFQNCMDRFGNAHQPPSPRRHPPSIHPLHSKKQSHNEDSRQWNKLVWFVLGH